MTTDFDSIDFFRAGALYQDPYPFYEYLRAHGPVWRELRVDTGPLDVPGLFEFAEI